jgi:hypothetical protein
MLKWVQTAAQPFQLRLGFETANFTKRQRNCFFLFRLWRWFTMYCKLAGYDVIVTMTLDKKMICAYEEKS